MSHLMYGRGLRLMELLRLRVKDLDLQQEIITVRGGKGNKDRFAPLPHCVVDPLKTHLQELRSLYEADRASRVAGVWLPDSLERKYPNAGQEWAWFWVWPEKSLSEDPRAAVIRRHHLLDRTFRDQLGLLVFLFCMVAVGLSMLARFRGFMATQSRIRASVVSPRPAIAPRAPR